MTRFLSRELLVRLRAFRMRPSLKRPRPADLHVTALGHGYSSHIHADLRSKLSAPVFEHIYKLHSCEHVTRYQCIFFRQTFPEMSQSLDNLSKVNTQHTTVCLLLVESHPR